MKKMVFLLLVVPGVILAQVETQAIYFTSDDDIWSAYYRGELTYEQTLELIDLYETKLELNTGDLTRLLWIPGFDEDDLKELENLRAVKGSWKNIREFEKDYKGDIELIMPFIRVSPVKAKAVRGEFYLYNYSKYKNLGQSIVTSDSVDEYGQYYTIIDTISTYYPPKYTMSLKLTSKTYGNLTSYFEQSGGNSIICKRRTYNLSRKNFFLSLGNFNYSFGEGILVGRHPTISSSIRNHTETEPNGKTNDKISKYYITPKDAWMNGLYLTTTYKRFSPAIIFSMNDFSELRLSLFAAKFEYKVDKNKKVGVAYEHSTGGKRITYRSDGVSLFFYAPFDVGTIEGEIGYLPRTTTDTLKLKNQYALAIRTSRSKDNIKTGFDLWHYSKDFTNMFTYSLADPNYYYTELGDTLKNPYRYYNRYKGESGGELRTDIRFGTFSTANLKIRYTVDRTTNASNIYITPSLTLYPNFLDELTLTYSLKKDSLTALSYFYEYYKMYVAKRFENLLELRGFVQLSTRLSTTYGYYKSTYDRLEIRLLRLSPFLIKLSFKWSDPNFEKKADGYFEATAEQNIEFAGLEFDLRYDFRRYEQKTTDKQHTFRFNLRYNF